MPQVRLWNLQVKFVYQGHWIKVKVTGAISVCVLQAFAVRQLLSYIYDATHITMF